MTVESFLSALKKSDLLTPEQFTQAQEAARYLGDAEDLARVLARADLITLWQAGQLLAGRTSFLLGKFKLIKLLGRGGMGSVFLARHVAMNRQVALKIVSKQVGHDPASMERFFSEARAAAALDHPNIVRAYDVDSEGDRFFIVMEYVEGRDLQAIVEDDGPLDFDLAADYIRQAADGLAHAHSRNMIHCDIKPSNLIVNNQGVVKILDLGVARLEGGKAERTNGGGKGQVLGSVDFLAPEQAMGSPNFDKRADIYSLGCTLYYLLTGRPPFPEGTLAERILKHQGQAPRSIVSLRSGTPPELVFICRTMMAKSPADRYQTAEEVSWVLQDWRSVENLPRAQPLEEEPTKAAPAAQAPLPAMSEETAWKPAMAPPPRVQPPPKRKSTTAMWPIWVGGGAAGILLAVLAVFILRAMQKPQPVHIRPAPPSRTTPAPVVKQTAKPVAPKPESPTGSPGAAQKPAPKETPMATVKEPAAVTPSTQAKPSPEQPKPLSTAAKPAEAEAKPKPAEAAPPPKAPPKTELLAEVTLPPAPSSSEPPPPPLALGTITPDAQASLSLELVGGTGAVRGEQDLVLNFEEPRRWTISATRLSAGNAPSISLAQISLKEDALQFAWLPEATEYLAGSLRNCLLLVHEGGNAHQVRLGKARLMDPILVRLWESKAPTLDLGTKKTVDPASLRLEVIGLEGPLPNQVIRVGKVISTTKLTDEFSGTGNMKPRILFRMALAPDGSSVTVSLWIDTGAKNPSRFNYRSAVSTLTKARTKQQARKQDDAQSKHTAALLALCSDPQSAGKVYFRVFREVDGHQIDLVTTPPLPPVSEPSTN